MQSQNTGVWLKNMADLDYSVGNSPVMLAGSLLVRDTEVTSPEKQADDVDEEGQSDPRIEIESASGNSCMSVILVEDAADDHACYYDEVVYVSDDYMEEEDENDSLHMLEESVEDDETKDSPKKTPAIEVDNENSR